MAAKRPAVRSATLRLVRLEDRCVPANIVVNIAGEDTNPGHGMISLRDAIATANSNNQANTVTFAPGITTVTVTSPLQVTAAGQANATTIDGGGVVTVQMQAQAGSVFILGPSGLVATGTVYAELRGMTITGGSAVLSSPSRFGVNGGGGIDVGQNATATLDHVIVRANSTGYAGTQFRYGGGGILNYGVMQIDACTVAGNVVPGDRYDLSAGGGGIYNGGQLTIEGSTVSGNTANASGGGIYNVGQIVVEDSTISGNTAVSENGGGIIDGGTSSIINSTVSGNQALQNAGGIEAGATTTLTNVTIANNRTANTGAGAGGGVYSTGAKANNTIISGNFAGLTGTTADDLGGSLAAAGSHNLIGGNAKLGPLANNGGPTLTHIPLFGSPAIDAGNNGLALDENGNLLTTDQRGDPRLFGGVFSGTVDIGAVETQGTPPAAANQLIAAGAGRGGAPWVHVYNAQGALQSSFLAYNSAFLGGVNVAVGDVNGDGTSDIITGAGAGGGPHVEVFDGTKLNTVQANGTLPVTAVLASFFAYVPTFTGGVNVAVGDVNGDGKADIVTGAGGGGGPHVEAFDGAKLNLVQANGTLSASAVLASFFAYVSSFTGGVNVAAGDVNGDGKADIITGAGPGGGPHVEAFDGAALTLGGSAAANAIANPLRSFFAYAPTLTGGVSVAVGDVNGDGKNDIITGAGAGGGPHVKAFDVSSLAQLASFFAYTPTFAGGVRVASVQALVGSGAEIVTGPGMGLGPIVGVFNANSTETASFPAFDPSFLGGVFIG
jgi:hypothetical protein